MLDQSKNLSDETLMALLNFTPSPALADGPSLSSSPAGPKIKKSGPGVAPASPTAPRASKKATPTSATSGPPSSPLSKSDALNLSLANRLRARLSTVGSIEYTQTWKELATPSGRRYWAHTASARTIYVNVSTGAPTLAPFATPQCHDTNPRGAGNRENPKGGGACLAWDAKLTGWPKTPAACDGEGGTFDVMKAIRENLNPKAKLRDRALVAGWPTASVFLAAGDPEKVQARRAECKERHGNNGFGMNLEQAAQSLAGWPTTTTRDSKSEGKDGPNRTGAPSLPAVALGVILDLFFVPTGRRVVLAPEFSLWLMGFPEAWVTAAPGAKDWREAQAALELGCLKDQGTPSSLPLPPNS